MKILFALFGAVGLIVFFGLLVSLPVMLLWNYCLVGAVTGVNAIGWWQAWGLMILCGLLFKSSIETKK
jgi:hypothetical protein